jgi:hypothetical protein
MRYGLPEGVFICFASRQRQLGLPISISASGPTMSVCQLMSFSTDLNVVHLRHPSFLFGRPFWQSPDRWLRRDANRATGTARTDDEGARSWEVGGYGPEGARQDKVAAAEFQPQYRS